jgi:hypothetical protein
MMTPTGSECLSGKNTIKFNALWKTLIVMPGLVPGIHAFAAAAGTRRGRVDGRVKPGHDMLFKALVVKVTFPDRH